MKPLNICRINQGFCSFITNLKINHYLSPTLFLTEDASKRVLLWKAYSTEKFSVAGLHRIK